MFAYRIYSIVRVLTYVQVYGSINSFAWTSPRKSDKLLKKYTTLLIWFLIFYVKFDY